MEDSKGGKQNACCVIAESLSFSWIRVFTVTLMLVHEEDLEKQRTLLIRVDVAHVTEHINANLVPLVGFGGNYLPHALNRLLNVLQPTMKHRIHLLVINLHHTDIPERRLLHSRQRLREESNTLFPWVNGALTIFCTVCPQL